MGVLNERAQPARSPRCATSWWPGSAAPAGVYLHRDLHGRDGHPNYVADGRNKNEAKAAAAAGLLEQFTEAERSAAAKPWRGQRNRMRGATQGIFGRLLKAGCALDFQLDGSAFRVSHPAGGELPAPLAGWTVPLPAALPILAGPAVSAAPHPCTRQARAWAAAARSALVAVSARRVYRRWTRRAVTAGGWRWTPQGRPPG